MRVLHLASEYPPARVYGLGRFVHGLARAQAAQGDEVLVLTNSDGGAEDGVLLDGVQVHRIAFPNPPRPADGLGEVLQWNHGVVSRLLDRMPVFEDVDLVVGHDYYGALAGREAAALLNRPLLLTLHDEVVGKQFGVLGPDVRQIRDLEALATHDAAHVIANSAFMARETVRHYGLAAERVTAVPGGIDPALLDVAHPGEVAALRRGVLGGDGPLVLYAGRLDPEKGLGTLCEAWPRVLAASPQARLLMAGTGRLEERLREQLGEGARLLGYVERQALAYLYRAADVVVVPSVYEPFGLVALEVMLAGRALVASDAGGLAEIVRHEENGLSVPAGDAGALGQAVLRLSSDPALRERLGKAARERVLRDHAWERIAERTRAIYEQVLTRSREGRAGRPCEAPPQLPAPPLVSVVLRAGGDQLRTAETVRSLVSRTAHRPLELLLVAMAVEPSPALQRALDLGRPAGPGLGGLRVDVHATAEHALAACQGEHVLLLTDEVAVPAGSEEWLAGLLWLMGTRGAAAVSPVLSPREEAAAPQQQPAEPRRVSQGDPRCSLVRREDAETLLVGDALPGEHWEHPVALAAIDPTLPASVVLVAYKNLHLTREALEAVLRHTAPLYELVLVDNGSGDGTREYFRDLEVGLAGTIPVQLLENEQNLGYPVGANQGIRAARGRHVVVLNSDTVVRPGWLGALLEAASSGPRVGLVTGKVLNLDGSVQSAGGIVHLPDGGFEIPFQGEDRLAPPVERRREVPNAGGPCLLLTRALLDELVGGPFDEAYSPGYFEDSDLSLRAREAGFSCLYEPRAELHHHGKATAALVAREGSQDVWGQFSRNERRFRERWAGRLKEDARALVVGEAPPRLRILLCYGRSETTTAAYCERALRREHEVVTAGPGQELDLGPASAQALVEAAGGEVDLLLMVEGENYFPAGLEEAPCPTAVWLIDTHLHARDESGWHLGLAREVEHVFLAQRDALSLFAREGIAAMWLPLACDPELHVATPPASGRDLDVVFVGHVRPFHQRRRRLLERLQHRFRLHAYEGVWGPEMARLFARARLAWNCSLAGDLNMRVFEALASGACVVTDRIESGLPQLFAAGEHLLTYSEEDLEEVVASALSDTSAREAVAARGQRLVLRHHTYVQRMRSLVERVLAGRREEART